MTRRQEHLAAGAYFDSWFSLKLHGYLCIPEKCLSPMKVNLLAVIIFFIHYYIFWYFVLSLEDWEDAIHNSDHPKGLCERMVLLPVTEKKLSRAYTLWQQFCRQRRARCQFWVGQRSYLQSQDNISFFRGRRPVTESQPCQSPKYVSYFDTKINNIHVKNLIKI